jgi:hypothetical protein
MFTPKARRAGAVSLDTHRGDAGAAGIGRNGRGTWPEKVWRFKVSTKSDLDSATYLGIPSEFDKFWGGR